MSKTLLEEEVADFSVSEAAQTARSPQVDLTQFCQTRLTPQSQELLQAVIEQPDRLFQFTEQPEAFWEWAEQTVGTITQADRHLLEILAKLFLFRPDATAVIRIENGSNGWCWYPG